jgi:protein-disulfide isomerase
VPRERRAVIANTVSVASLLVISVVTVWAVAGTGPARSNWIRTGAGMAPVALTDAAALGNPAAPVALIVFSDFQCPYCRAFALGTLPAVIERYVRPGKVLVAFRHFPLDIHSDARRAAEFAECARRKGRFWELHDAIFRNTSGFKGDWLASVAATAGMPSSFFADCPSAAAVERINQDIALGAVLEATSTPTLLIGPIGSDRTVRIARVLKGASTPEAVGDAIDTVLGRTPQRGKDAAEPVTNGGRDE